MKTFKSLALVALISIGAVAPVAAMSIPASFGSRISSSILSALNPIKNSLGKLQMPELRLPSNVVARMESGTDKWYAAKRTMGQYMRSNVYQPVKNSFAKIQMPELRLSPNMLSRMESATGNWYASKTKVAQGTKRMLASGLEDIRTVGTAIAKTTPARFTSRMAKRVKADAKIVVGGLRSTNTFQSLRNAKDAVASSALAAKNSITSVVSRYAQRNTDAPTKLVSNGHVYKWNDVSGWNLVRPTFKTSIKRLSLDLANKVADVKNALVSGLNNAKNSVIKKFARNSKTEAVKTVPAAEVVVA